MSIVSEIENKYRKPQVVLVRSGDNVKVHQKIREAGKERVQIFEGLVIRTDRRDSLTNRITVRKVTSGVGVEKSFLLHSPNVLKIDVTKRSKVHRNYLSYMRLRTGKSARLSGLDFDSEKVNSVRDFKAEAEEEKLKEETAKAAELDLQAKAKEEAKLEAKAEAAIAAHDQIKK